MKVGSGFEKDFVEFRTLRPGDVFSIGRDFYMRTPELTGTNCVLMHSGLHSAVQAFAVVRRHPEAELTLGRSE